MVQGTLGHGSIVVTSDIYTSVLPEVYHRSAQAIARLVMARARATAREARKIAAWPHDAGMPHTCLTISRRLHGSRLNLRSQRWGARDSNPEPTD
ncbi:hypothetical protein GCM10023074_42220 [Microbispora amethystogenes]|uniref:Integrase n=1 Tax=Microbispora amethystogenes TaxID=1427754 RepID=A0ABQ4FDN5_9ACTN|nr:hypothetical protein Mam01_30650 [Microbispora amethystogenes]